MNRRLLCSLLVVAAWSAPALGQSESDYQTVAITEFIASPIGEPDAREWVELFNFGKDPVDLENFSFSDGKNDICKIPKVTIKPGDFVIVVLGNDVRRYGEERKKIFETEWLGGKEDPRVVGIESRFSLDRVDTIMLQNRAKVVIWTLGYSGDDRGGNSTYLAVDNFDIRGYGTPDAPAINRNGNDGQALGYEGQFATKEDLAWTSDVSKLEAVGGFIYKTTANGGANEPSIGSPLKGKYTAGKQ